MLAGQPNNHTHVVINLGVNDFGIATMGPWIADMETVIDAVHARYPQASIWVMYPWKRSFDATAATYHTWVDQIITDRPFVIAGPDEAVWLKGSDDGATNTYDGIHYSYASGPPNGETACAAQWQTKFGY